MSELFLGCRKCLSEGKKSGKVVATGSIRILMGQGCSIKCRNCESDLEFIENAQEAEGNLMLSESSDCKEIEY